MRIQNLFYWRSMKNHARIFLASCLACLSFQTASRRAHEPLTRFCAWEKNDIVALDFVAGQTASQPRPVSTTLSS